eukprot:755167-Hanusia_phi.AAC.2
MVRSVGTPFRARPPPLLLLLLLLLSYAVPSCVSSQNSSDDKLAKLLRRMQEERSPEMSELAMKFESTQNRFLRDVKNTKVLFLRMEQAAGLGNRLVALVSGFIWSLISDRALLVEWVSYDQPMVHRSKEVSTMIDLAHFLSLPAKLEVHQVLKNDKAMRVARCSP